MKQVHFETVSPIDIKFCTLSNFKNCSQCEFGSAWRCAMAAAREDFGDAILVAPHGGQRRIAIEEAADGLQRFLTVNASQALGTGPGGGGLLPPWTTPARLLSFPIGTLFSVVNSV